MGNYWSKQFYIEKYGEEEGNKKYDSCLKLRAARERRKNSGRSFVKKQYTEDDLVSGLAIRCRECSAILPRLQWTHFKYKCTGVVKSLEEYKCKYPNEIMVSPVLKKALGVTLENMKLAYGEEEGNKRWKVYCDKQAEKNTYEFKKEKYGWSKEKFDEFNKSRSVTLENLIKRHGEKEGIKIWDEYIERQRYTNTIEYFIEKYGVDKGTEKYYEYNKEKGSFSDPEYISKKYNISVEEAISKIEGYARHGEDFTSELEKNFICLFEDALGSEVAYTYKNKQFCIWSKQLWSPVFYDLCDSNIKKIIEINGDFWHCNPKTYSPDYINAITKKTSKETWEHDNIKTQEAIDRGFSVLTIWESEFNDNPKEILERAIKWWKS